MSDIVTIIEPSYKLKFINFKEVWEYRELLWAFVKRDIQIRYKQTLIGGLWAILQPFLAMIIFSFFFGYLAKIPGNGVPYPIFSYAGLVLWSYFTNALSTSSACMIGNAGLVTKVYFPRIILPIAATMVGLIDYVVASMILVGLMFYFHIFPTLAILVLPFVVLLTWMLASGIGFWLSAINVKYRDVGYVVPFFIQMLLFVTPIIYPSAIAPNFQWLLMANPLTGIIETHRALLFGLPIPYVNLMVSICISLVIFFTGSTYFRSVEKYFADII